MYIVFFFKNIIEYFYIKYNQPSVIFKRDFNLFFIEKIFLINQLQIFIKTTVY